MLCPFPTFSDRMAAERRNIVILELEGLHQDDSVEQTIWGPSTVPHNIEIEFLRANLCPGGSGDLAPISSLSNELCSRVHGLMVFRSECWD